MAKLANWTFSPVVWGKKIGVAYLELDYSKAEKFVAKADRAVLNATQKAEVSYAMANTLIKGAQPIIPYKQYYTLKKRTKKTKTKITRGKNKGKVKYKASLIPPSKRYYRWELNKQDNAYVNTTTSSTTTTVKKTVISTVRYKDKRKNTRIIETVSTGYNSKKLGQVVSTSHISKQGKRVQDTSIAIPTETKKTYSGMGRVAKSLTTSSKSRVWWKEGKDYFPVMKKVETKEGPKYVFAGSYKADFPPHLRDTEYTHQITVQSGAKKGSKALVTISARKPRNKKFANEGGEEYGVIQYYSWDRTWKRSSKEPTTSRWLEVAAGHRVPGVKMTTWSGSKAVMRDVKNIVRLEVNKQLKRI